MTDLGKSDDQVGHAIADMRDALNAMLEATDVSSGRGGEIDRLVEDDLNVALSLDPKKIADEFDRLRQSAFQIGEDAESVVSVRQAKDLLRGWHGAAADEFRSQLDRIERFITTVSTKACCPACNSSARCSRWHTKCDRTTTTSPSWCAAAPTTRSTSSRPGRTSSSWRSARSWCSRSWR